MAWISKRQPVVGPRGERVADPGQPFTNADLEAAVPGYAETDWWRVTRRKLHALADDPAPAGAASIPTPPPEPEPTPDPEDEEDEEFWDEDEDDED